MRLTCLTPAAVHEGRGEAILARRHQTIQAAYAAHPARFPNGPPRRSTLPGAVWINPPEDRTHVELCLANARKVSLPGLEASGGEIALESRIGEGAARRARPGERSELVLDATAILSHSGFISPTTTVEDLH